MAQFLLRYGLMTLSNQKNGLTYDRQSAEVGSVATTLEGVTYIGFYRVRAEGQGRQRFNVTADKTVTVEYKGRTRFTAVGMRGLEITAETLLCELVAMSAVAPAHAVS